MVDELKSIRNNLFKVISSLSTGDEEDEDEDLAPGDERAPLLDARTARALFGALFSRAGKGKDEIIQIVAREIGVAVAAMLKEPLSQLAQHQKLQISFELVPKSKKTEAADSPAPKQRKAPRPAGKHSPRAKKPGKGAV